MPLIALRLGQTLYSQAVALVDAGEYVDLQQLMEVALRNHLQLEKHHSPATARVEEAPQPWHLVRTGLKKSSTGTTAPATRAADATNAEGLAWHRIIAPFRFIANASAALEPCATMPRPAEEHLYALVNRLFPLKLIARWLDIHANAAGKWTMAAEAAAAFGTDAEALGSALAEQDRAHDRARDHQLATSLPRIENPKSRERFTTQFVARANEAQEVYAGAVVQFALAAVKNGQLVLTDAGQALSRIDNRLIDENDADVSETLNEDERALLVSQIGNYMPAEAAHMSAVLNTVKRGAESPEKIIAEFGGRFSGRLTDAAVRSYLSGIVARAIDLKLLGRERQGRNAFYHVTEYGSAVLDDFASKLHTTGTPSPQ